MKLAFRYLSLLFVLFFADFTPGQETFKEKGLFNFSQVNSSLYRGAQPTELGVKELAQMGVKTIIDLRGEDKLSEKEKLWAENSGVKFISVNLSNWLKPKTADIERIVKEINAPENQPVFVHCQRGADRTGTVVAVYRMLHDNWTAKQAIGEAKKFDFGWWQFWMKDYIKDYEKNHIAGNKSGNPILIEKQ